MRILLDQLPADFSDEPGAPWIQGRKPGIDVKIALRSRSEGEISPANGVPNQYVEQFLLVRLSLHSGRRGER